VVDAAGDGADGVFASTLISTSDDWFSAGWSGALGLEVNTSLLSSDRVRLGGVSSRGISGVAVVRLMGVQGGGVGRGFFRGFSLAKWGSICAFRMQMPSMFGWMWSLNSLAFTLLWSGFRKAFRVWMW